MYRRAILPRLSLGLPCPRLPRPGCRGEAPRVTARERTREPGPQAWRAGSCLRWPALLVAVGLMVSAEERVSAQVAWVQRPDPVLDVGAPEAWDSESVFVESLLRLPDGMRLWYRGTNDPAASVDWQIGCARSSGFVAWEKLEGGLCFPFEGTGRWDDLSFGASVLFDAESGLFKMWYGGAQASSPLEFRIGHATSPDGVAWSRVGDEPVLIPETFWERTAVDSPRVQRWDDQYHMWYTGRNFSAVSTWQIGYATSVDGVSWRRYGGNPVLSGGGRGDPVAVYIPNVLVDPDTGLLEMWFVHRTTTRIGLGYALSLDGAVWTEYEGNPLSLVTRLPVRGALTGGIARDGDTYHMIYNGWWGGEIYRGHYATAPWTLPRPVFVVERNGDQVLVDGSRSTAPASVVGYRWDFGDGVTNDDGGPQVEHRYAPGTYRLELRVTDATGRSAAVARQIEIPATVGPFLRGDCDSDGRATGVVTDAVFLLTFSFLGGAAPACLAACDADGDGALAGQVTDAVFLLAHSFLGAPPPPSPFPDCGTTSATSDRALGCVSSPCP